MMFAFIGSATLYVATDVLTVGGTLPPNVVMAALGNGFMLAVASEPPFFYPLIAYHDLLISACSCMHILTCCLLPLLRSFRDRQYKRRPHHANCNNCYYHHWSVLHAPLLC